MQQHEAQWPLLRLAFGAAAVVGSPSAGVTIARSLRFQLGLQLLSAAPILNDDFGGASKAAAGASDGATRRARGGVAPPTRYGVDTRGSCADLPAANGVAVCPRCWRSDAGLPGARLECREPMNTLPAGAFCRTGDAPRPPPVGDEPGEAPTKL